MPGGEMAGFAHHIARLPEADELAMRLSKASLAWSKEFDWNLAATEMAGALERARRGR